MEDNFQPSNRDYKFIIEGLGRQEKFLRAFFLGWKLMSIKRDRDIYSLLIKDQERKQNGR